MEAIIKILEDEDNNYDSYGPFDEDALAAILVHVEAVHGEGFSSPRAVTPAALPEECSRPLPDACPTQGLYGLNMIRAPAVWNVLPGIVNQNPTVRAVVLDSGVQPTHVDLRANLEPGLSVHFGNADLTPNPPFDALANNHGTHVCGTVFAAHNNGRDSAVGVVGNALGISCGCSGDFPDACVARCVQHARTNRARIINMSFGQGRPERLAENNVWRVQVERFCDSGGLIIVAAGNDGLEVPNAPIGNGAIGIGYPEAFVQDLRATRPKCQINVANVQDNQQLADSSQWGTLVQVAAPGTEIKSSIGPNDATAQYSGTSMAAPHVTGMATLLFNEFPAATAEQVYDCIVTTATRPVRRNPTVNQNRPVGGGIVDVQAAYNCMLTSVACPTTGVPNCVDASSGRPVATCDSQNFFCHQVGRQTCRYNRLPDNTLCDVAPVGAAMIQQLLEEVSAAELAAIGFTPDTDDDNQTLAETQQANQINKAARREAARARRNARRNSNQNGKLRNCGVCRAGTCVAQQGKVCRNARPRPAQAT